MHSDGKGKLAQQVAIAPTGPHLAVRYGDGIILVWRLDRMKLLLRRDVPSDRPPDGEDAAPVVALSPNGRLLDYDVDDHPVHRVEVWDLGTKRRIRQLPATDDTYALKFSQEGRRLAMAGTSMGYYDLATGRFTGVFISSGEPPDSEGAFFPTDVAFGPNGRSVVVSSFDYFAVWSPGQKRCRFVPISNGLSSSVSPDGSTVAFTTTGPAVSLWDARSGRELRNWRLADPSSSVLQLSGRGILLVGGSTARTDQPTVELFRLPAGTPAGRHTLPRELDGNADMLGYDPRGLSSSMGPSFASTNLGEASRRSQR